MRRSDASAAVCSKQLGARAIPRLLIVRCRSNNPTAAAAAVRESEAHFPACGTGARAASSQALRRGPDGASDATGAAGASGATVRRACGDAARAPCGARRVAIARKCGGARLPRRSARNSSVPEPSRGCSSLDVVAITRTAAPAAGQRVGGAFSGVLNRHARRVIASASSDVRPGASGDSAAGASGAAGGALTVLATMGLRSGVAHVVPTHVAYWP